MQVFGLMMVRNEADILRINLLHHLALGIDQFLIVDNGSTDSTPEILDELSQDTGRVRWLRDDGPYRQADITTGLAHEAYLEGANWVMPIDADEFWCAPGGDLRGVLERTEAGALEVQLVNFVQSREQLEATPEGLLQMTRRVAHPVGPIERIVELVESRQIGFVEIFYPPKWISRATAGIEIGIGNHNVSGIMGAREATDELVRFGASTLWPQFASAFGQWTQAHRRPLRDLSKWHLALALAAGQICGAVRSNNGRTLLIKGDTFKEKETTVEHTERADGSLVETRILTDKFVPVIRGIDFTPGPTFGEIVTIR